MQASFPSAGTSADTTCTAIVTPQACAVPWHVRPRPPPAGTTYTLVSQRLSRTMDTAMMPMPTNTPRVVHLLAGSKEMALQQVHSADRQGRADRPLLGQLVSE